MVRQRQAESHRPGPAVGASAADAGILEQRPMDPGARQEEQAADERQSDEVREAGSGRVAGEQADRRREELRG
jgi:hypothetical protein